MYVHIHCPEQFDACQLDIYCVVHMCIGRFRTKIDMCKSISVCGISHKRGDLTRCKLMNEIFGLIQIHDGLSVEEIVSDDSS